MSQLWVNMTENSEITIKTYYIFTYSDHILNLVSMEFLNQLEWCY